MHLSILNVTSIAKWTLKKKKKAICTLFSEVEHHGHGHVPFVMRWLHVEAIDSNNWHARRWMKLAFLQIYICPC